MVSNQSEVNSLPLTLVRNTFINDLLQKSDSQTLNIYRISDSLF